MGKSILAVVVGLFIVLFVLVLAREHKRAILAEAKEKPLITAVITYEDNRGVMKVEELEVMAGSKFRFKQRSSVSTYIIRFIQTRDFVRSWDGKEETRIPVSCSLPPVQLIDLSKGQVFEIDLHCDIK